MLIGKRLGGRGSGGNCSIIRIARKRRFGEERDIALAFTGSSAGLGLRRKSGEGRFDACIYYPIMAAETTFAYIRQPNDKTSNALF